MKITLFNKKILFKLVIIILIIFIILITILGFTKDRIANPNKKYNLRDDGFVIIKNVLNKGEIDYVKNQCIENNYYNAKKFLLDNKKLKNNVNNMINEKDYIFQDYIWVIKKSSVHTCHRDNNGDFFNKGQKYPSYTLLIYLEDMDKCLGVIPSSHKNVNSYNIDLNNSVLNLLCNSGDAILFNANLIHVGALNIKPDNLRIQMKLSHKDDIEVLSYYEDFNKVLDKDNNLPFMLKKIQKNATCMFPGISNLTQSENIKSARGSDNGANIGIFQKIFSYLFYGNANFYDLPNAF
jgi:hypothetical protein